MESSVPKPKKRGNAKLVVAAVAAVLAIVFVIINTNQVEINFLFFKLTAPLLVALIVSMLLGFIVGLIFPKLRADRSNSQG
ncbi:MAG: LapA family protein [bacterium]